MTHLFYDCLWAWTILMSTLTGRRWEKIFVKHTEVSIGISFLDWLEENKKQSRHMSWATTKCIWGKLILLKSQLSQNTRRLKENYSLFA